MAKEYEVLEAGLAIAVNTANEVSLGDLQRCAEQAFGPGYNPDWTRVEVRDHCLIINNSGLGAAKQLLELQLSLVLSGAKSDL